MKQFESLLADNIFLYVNLNALPCPLQVRKTGFPHEPQGYDATGDPDLTLG